MYSLKFAQFHSKHHIKFQHSSHTAEFVKTRHLNQFTQLGKFWRVKNSTI